MLQGLARKYSPSENSIEVNFELTSNWGHKNLIGLTEIQFYDMDRQVIPVRKEEVSVHGAGQQQGPIDVLFNGKTKVNSQCNELWLRWKQNKSYTLYYGFSHPLFLYILIYCKLQTKCDISWIDAFLSTCMCIIFFVSEYLNWKLIDN